MRVEDWMKLPIHVVKPRDTVAHARALLEEHRINQLPVAVNGRLVGIVTDRDLRDAPRAVEVSAAAATRRREGVPPSPTEIPVEAVMSDAVLMIGPHAGLEEAALLMRRQRVGALPIVENGRLVGILTRSDILDAFVALASHYRSRAEP
ncbi:MAG: CBS domain-containing protein [Candidatus Binataceae bacterium]